MARANQIRQCAQQTGTRLNRHILAAALSAIAALASPWSRTAESIAAAQETGQASQRTPPPTSQPKPEALLDDRVLSSALCSVVYQVDRSPSPRGYRYLFYGNAFFINKDGYALTAAHVLGPLHGGQPYLLLRTPDGAPRFVPAAVATIDRDHDVAILRATPNPFDGDFAVSYLPLDHRSPPPGQTVLAASRHPSKPRDSYSLEPVFDERSSGAVLDFEFSQLEKGRADTELFLFSHSVRPGESGAPVISADSHGVVGFVEGQWLRPYLKEIASPQSPPSPGALTPLVAPDAAPIPGAVVPIHYAVALLQYTGIAWHTASEDSPDREQAAGKAGVSSRPSPFSLVPAPYPSESFFGGEVLLDALVNRVGTLYDIRVISGEQPFLAEALAAVHTWTFLPAHSNGQVSEARITIAFQFPQPYVPPRSSDVHDYDEGRLATADNRAAFPLTTVEPDYPSATNVDGSVILYESIDSKGELASVQVVQGVEPLTEAALAVAHKWQFAPARQSGAVVDSVAILVVTFRRPLVIGRARQ